LLESLPRAGGVLHAGDYATRFRLVQNIVRDNFKNDRKAEPRGEFRRLRGILGQRLFRRGDTIGVAELLRLGGGQSSSPGGERVVDQCAQGFFVHSTSDGSPCSGYKFRTCVSKPTALVTRA